ncbi:MAG: GlsB/YeaQ/YmgE family stress response membrane protein [Acidobacteria bacterium]|nr:GlsB/YeaQ/YmgE family stress response membrane protein [Acidobacteriota bacterium]
MFAIIGWIVFGLIAGIIAKAIMPGRDPGGAIVTILLGIAGSVVGGFIGRTLFYRADSEPGTIMSMVFAVIGAIILLAGYRLIRGNSLRT